ncbi:MAG: hypothetical protein ACI89J_000818, partial [Hyphomicrobiaceae bacterium]
STYENKAPVTASDPRIAAPIADDDTESDLPYAVSDDFQQPASICVNSLGTSLKSCVFFRVCRCFSRPRYSLPDAAQISVSARI